jgi:hydrogenase maturation protease
MSRELVDRIADAVLYEGYVLYPYRPSIKNRQRWTFGGLYPEAYCQAHDSGDAWSNQTEILVHGDSTTCLGVTVRFLHLLARLVGELPAPLMRWPEQGEPVLRFVPSLRIGDRLFQAWQEAEERTVVCPDLPLGELLAQPWGTSFSFSGRRWLELLQGTTGEFIGALVREQQAIEGAVEVSAAPADEGLFRVTIRVLNETPLAEAEHRDRDEALLRALVSTHAILRVRQGKFVSLLDPPENWREAAAACRNVGSWPVLVGPAGSRETMLSSPIILYDYPEVAPESPGDFFDGTEIDEMLSLRIMTLTDEEKLAMAAVDDKARALLTRTEAMLPEQMLGLHGTMRGLRSLTEETSHD